MSNYLQQYLDTPVPQTEPLNDRQVLNDAGGYVYPVDDEVQMHRFLIMGSENGSYYSSERTMTRENAEASARHIAQAGVAAVDHIVDVAVNRRAPKVAPGLFCLALAASAEDEDTRKAALGALPTVATTASMLEEFASYVNSMRGWGRCLRSAVNRWYTEKEPEDLAYQAIKYRTRKGWSQYDLLQKCHPKVEKHSDIWHIFEWITTGTAPPDTEPFRRIHAYIKAQELEDPKEMARLVADERLPREAVPPAMLEHDLIWEALAPNMPPRAFISNLPALTTHGVIRPMEAQWAVDRINRMRPHTTNDGRQIPAPVHPVRILLAMMIYRMGHSVDGKSKWQPVPQISAALDEAFDQSFSAAPSTGQRIYLAVDTSGSMGSHELNKITGLTARMAAAAVTMAIARREPNHLMVACSNRMENLDVTARDSLQDVMAKTQALNYMATDMALPILHAAEREIPVDCFVIATDGQTFAGSIHPTVALQQYRKRMGIPAKAVQLAFYANKFSILDPQDAGTLDLVGFDAALPTMLHDFIVGMDGVPGSAAELDEDDE